MKKASRLLPAYLLLVVFATILWISPLGAQDKGIPPVEVGQPFPDFKLSTYQGPYFSPSSIKPKNIMLIFPRGYAAEGRWCTICSYKFVELYQLNQIENLQNKYNTWIIFVFPYGKEIVQNWLDSLPSQMEKIQTWKYPSDPKSQDEKAKKWTEQAKILFPLDLRWNPTEMSSPFLLLLDPERTLSKGLGIFRTEWSGSKVDQNIPSVFIIDEKGILRYKYVAKNTADRPSYEELFKFMESLNAKK